MLRQTPPTFHFHKVERLAVGHRHIGVTSGTLSRTHLYLALVAVLIGFLVALPLGCARGPGAAHLPADPGRDHDPLRAAVAGGVRLPWRASPA
jgi:hypothetical protein